MICVERLASVVLLLSCLTSPARAQQFTVREINATKGDRSTPFGEVADAVQTADGNLLIADGIAGVVWRWRPEEGAVERIFGRGEGPGEVLRPLQLSARPDGGVAVYDQEQSAVNLFDSSLGFEERVQLPGIVSWPKGMLALPDGTFVLAGGQLSHPNHLHRFTRAGRVVERWGSPHPEATNPSTRIQTAGGAVIAWSDTSFVFSQAAPIRIIEFAHAGWESPDTLVVDDQLAPPTDENFLIPSDRFTILRWGFPRSTFVYGLHDGRILNVVTRIEDDDSVWSIYSGSGDLLDRVTVDYPYEVRQWLARNRLLATRKDPLTDESMVVVLEVSGW